MSEASVWIDDVELQSLGIGVRLASDEPMFPDVRQQSVIIPGRHGAYDFGAFFDVRKFELDCVFPRQSHTELKRQIRDFVTLFVDIYGRPKTVKLRFGDELDKYYSVKVGGNVPIERLAGRGAFRLPLIAHDPVAKSVVTSDQLVMDSDTPLLSDILWDTGLSNRTITEPSTFTVINNGTMAVRFTYKIIGSGTNVTLTANGKTFSLGSISGKMVEVDGENFLVKIDGVNDLTMTSGDFIELLPGVNEVSVSGSGLNFTVSESLTYKYI
jgi:phage-related protein